MSKFTADNFKKGFLLDQELMAGITEAADAPGLFTAYVVRHTTGETLGTQQFTDVFEAIRTINDIPREWTYESTSGCGGNCAAGTCGKSGGGCNKKRSADQTTSANVTSASDATPCESGLCSDQPEM